jgi:hypothetical protein
MATLALLACASPSSQGPGVMAVIDVADRSGQEMTAGEAAPGGSERLLPSGEMRTPLAAGATDVTVTDIAPARLQRAAALDATRVIDTSTESLRELPATPRVEVVRLLVQEKAHT